MSSGSVLLFHRPTSWASFRSDPKGTLFTALIHLTTRSRWNHAALDIGDGKMVEATSEGVKVSPIASVDEIHAVDDTDCAERPPCRGCYAGNDLEDTLAWATGRVGNRYGYVTAAFCGLRNVFPGWSILQDKAFICSQLVADALTRAGHDFNKDAALVSPGDLATHFGVSRD